MGEYHFVLQNADWAGDVKDRRSHSGMSAWVKDSDEKHLGILCMLLSGNDLCKCCTGRSVLCKDSAATLNSVKRSLSDRYARTIKEMLQRQKDAVFPLGIEISIKHLLFRVVGATQ